QLLQVYALSLHDALPIYLARAVPGLAIRFTVVLAVDLAGGLGGAIVSSLVSTLFAVLLRDQYQRRAGLVVAGQVVEVLFLMENVRGRGIFAARVAEQHYRSIHLRAELGAALRINIVRLARARLSRGRGEENQQHEENRDNRREEILCAPAPMSWR